MPASICSWEKSPTLSNLFQDAHTYGVSPGRWCTFTYEKHNSSYETLALILSSDLLDHRLVTLLVPGCCARSPLFVSSTTGPECCFFPHCSEQHQDSQYQFELASCALPAYPPYGLRSGVIPYGFQAIMAHITSIGPAKRSAPLPALQAVLACLKDQYPHLHDIASSHHHQLLHSPNCHTTVTIRYGPYAGTVGQICGPNSRTREGYASVFLPCKPYPYSCHIPLGWIGTTVIPGDEVFYHDDDGMLIQGYVLKRNDAPQMTCDVADVTTVRSSIYRSHPPTAHPAPPSLREALHPYQLPTFNLTALPSECLRFTPQTNVSSPAKISQFSPRSIQSTFTSFDSPNVHSATLWPSTNSQPSQCHLGVSTAAVSTGHTASRPRLVSPTHGS